jgi:hypothetical protein
MTMILNFRSHDNATIKKTQDFILPFHKQILRLKTYTKNTSNLHICFLVLLVSSPYYKVHCSCLSRIWNSVPSFATGYKCLRRIVRTKRGQITPGRWGKLKVGSYVTCALIVSVIIPAWRNNGIRRINGVTWILVRNLQRRRNIKELSTFLTYSIGGICEERNGISVSIKRK